MASPGAGALFEVIPMLAQHMNSNKQMLML